MALVSILGRQSYGCFLVLLSISCTDTSNDFNAVEQQCGFAPKGRHLVQVVDRDGKPVANAKVESLRGEKVTLSPKGCFEADEESEGYRAAAPGRSIANTPTNPTITAAQRRSPTESPRTKPRRSSTRLTLTAMAASPLTTSRPRWRALRPILRTSK